MRDLTSPRAIHFKGLLFLTLGLLAAAVQVADKPTIRHVLLLAVAIWAFCRFYYYLFYVIERYINPTFRFAGLAAALRYVARSSSHNVKGPNPQ